MLSPDQSMDPAEFAAHMLPKIEYNEMQPSNSYCLRSMQCYDEFCEEFLDCVSGDCHAITLDDEILCNSYEPKSFRESLQDDMLWQHIIDYPQGIFDTLIKKGANARVIVYMSGQTPWFLAVYYNAALNLVTLEYYKSQKFIDANLENI